MCGMLWLNTGRLRTVLQFGKCGAKRYVLDMVAPLSPVQGFAALLSAFGWVPTEP